MSVGNDDDLELEHANGLAGRYDSATIPNLSDTRINLIAGLSLNCWWLVAQFLCACVSLRSSSTSSAVSVYNYICCHASATCDYD